HNRVSAYPWGAHYVPVPLADNRGLIDLLREMGVVVGIDPEGRPRIDEQYLVRDPDGRVVCAGRGHAGLCLRDGASSQVWRQLCVFRAEVGRWVASRGARGRRAFALPTAQGSDAPEVLALDGLTMARWMRERGFSSPRLWWLVDYACRDDYGMRAEHASAW